MELHIKIDDVKEALNILAILGIADAQIRESAVEAVKQSGLRTKTVETGVALTRKSTFKTKAKHSTNRHATGYTSERWSKGEDEQLKKFYSDPANHFSNGRLIGDGLERFAKSIGRSKGSVSVRLTTSGLTQKKVKGMYEDLRPSKSAKPIKLRPQLSK